MDGSSDWTHPGADTPPRGHTRLDAAVVQRGLARSRTRAAALIKDGVIEVDGRRVTKPATPVGESTIIRLSTAVESTFASRAGIKLTGALDAFGEWGPSIEGVDCLDVGASTGGFTDVLLRRGARSVVALDVGHGQLLPELRDDPRVHVIEGCNARELTAQTLPTQPHLVVADVSFISLTMILPAVSGSIPANADLVLMVKPQFEVGKARLGPGGVVRDPALHTDAVRAVVASGHDLGLGLRAVVASSLPGPGGNREFFVWLTRAAPRKQIEDDTIERAVATPLGESPAAQWVSQPTERTTGGRS